jgi:uncharacterized protein (UPF0261 family)
VNSVYVIGTCDTKGEELRFACDRVRSAGASAVLVDVSTHGEGGVDVAAFHPSGEAAVLGQKDRGQAVSAMAVALTHYLLSREDIGAVLGPPWHQGRWHLMLGLQISP